MICHTFLYIVPLNLLRFYLGYFCLCNLICNVFDIRACWTYRIYLEFFSSIFWKNLHRLGSIFSLKIWQTMQTRTQKPGVLYQERFLKLQTQFLQQIQGTSSYLFLLERALVMCVFQRMCLFNLSSHIYRHGADTTTYSHILSMSLEFEWSWFSFLMLVICILSFIFPPN